MNRAFKGVWIPIELLERYNAQTAALCSAFYQNPNLLSKKEIDYLKDKKVLVKRDLNPFDIKDLICKKTPQKGIGNEICSWCNGETLILHNHHFPVPKFLGGVETVSICPSCHYEYHFLKDNNYELLDEVKEILSGDTCE